MKIATLISPILQVETTVLVGTAEEKEEYLREEFGDAIAPESPHLEKGAAQFIIVHGNPDKEFLWIPSFKRDNQSIALVAHEVLHLAIHRLRDMEVSLTKSSEEVFTHYFQYYFVNLLTILDQCKKKSGKAQNKTEALKDNALKE